jgi:hypothetical protein
MCQRRPQATQRVTGAARGRTMALVRGHKLLITVALLVVLIGSTIAIASTGTHSGSADPVATSAYLSSRDAMLRDAKAELPNIRVAIDRAVVSASMRCAGVLSKASRGREFNAVDRELGLALTLVAFHVHARALAKFTHAIKDLRWKDRALTNLVRATAAQDKAEVKLPYPALCTELRQWAANDYRELPATIIQFLRVTTAIANLTSDEEQALGGPLESSDQIINRIVKQHLSTRERPLVRSVESLESKVNASEERLLVAGLTRFRAALGVVPASGMAGQQSRRVKGSSRARR